MFEDKIEIRFPWACRTYHPHERVVPWLKENIGEFDGEWYRYGSDIAQGIVARMPLYDVYRFRDEQDAVLFGLKWS